MFQIELKLFKPKSLKLCFQISRSLYIVFLTTWLLAWQVDSSSSGHKKQSSTVDYIWLIRASKIHGKITDKGTLPKVRTCSISLIK